MWKRPSLIDMHPSLLPRGILSPPPHTPPVPPPLPLYSMGEVADQLAVIHDTLDWAACEHRYAAARRRELGEFGREEPLGCCTVS